MTETTFSCIAALHRPHTVRICGHFIGLQISLSVSQCVGHTGYLCKNGCTVRVVVWKQSRVSTRNSTVSDGVHINQRNRQF